MASHPEPPVEVDESFPDDQSDYGSHTGSETQSLASSLYHYLEQNGRRYHTYYGPDKNPMPSDEQEKERLDITHELFYHAWKGTFYQAPLDPAKIHRVLDLGTGTGVWAIDFAQEHPQALVIGMDISPIQPNWVPSNCKFEVDDFELEWTWSAPFDFIHARTLAHSVSNWPRLLSEAYRCMSPGGYIELMEDQYDVRCDDNTMPADWPPKRIMDMTLDGLKRIGRKPPNGEEMRALLEQAGFIDVEVKHTIAPLGIWPRDKHLKQAGGLMHLSVEAKGYEAYASYVLHNILGMPLDEVKALCDEATEIHYREGRTKVHAYFDCYAAYGRKPETPVQK